MKWKVKLSVHLDAQEEVFVELFLFPSGGAYRVLMLLEASLCMSHPRLSLLYVTCTLGP